MDEGLNHWVQQYITSASNGVMPYFDADQMEELLDHFEMDSDLYEDYYEGLIALAHSLHPNNRTISLKKILYLLETEEDLEALEMLQTLAFHDLESDLLQLECYINLEQLDQIGILFTLRSEEQCEYLENLFEIFITDLNEEIAEYSIACKICTMALNKFPNNILILEALVHATTKVDNTPLESAINACNQLLDINPYSASYWISLGILYDKSEQYEKALEALGYAEVCKDVVIEEVIRLRACLYYQMSAYGKVIESYDQIGLHLLSLPDEVAIYAESLCQLKLFEKTLSFIAELSRINPEEINCNIFLQIKKIQALCELGREGEAEPIRANIQKQIPFVRIPPIQTMYNSDFELIAMNIDLIGQLDDESLLSMLEETVSTQKSKLLDVLSLRKHNFN